jgi:hypothetical protein
MVAYINESKGLAKTSWELIVETPKGSYLFILGEVSKFREKHRLDDQWIIREVGSLDFSPSVETQGEWKGSNIPNMRTKKLGALVCRVLGINGRNVGKVGGVFAFTAR